MPVFGCKFSVEDIFYVACKNRVLFVLLIAEFFRASATASEMYSIRKTVLSFSCSFFYKYSIYAQYRQIYPKIQIPKIKTIFPFWENKSFIINI